MKNILIQTISILLLISCNIRDEKKSNIEVNDLIMNVFLNSSPSQDLKMRLGLINNNKVDEILKVKFTKEIKNLGLTIKLHSIPPQCGGCWEYELIDISNKEGNHFVFPIMDAFWYNSYSGTINYTGSEDTLTNNVSYNEKTLTENILAHPTLQLNLNHIFSKDTIFSNYSNKDIEKVKIFIDELLSNFILNPTYRECKVYNEDKSIEECINKNKIHLTDTLKLYEQLIKKQNLDRESKDLAVKSKRFEKQTSEIKRVIDNLKNKPDKYLYFWFFDAIYEFEIFEQTETKRPFVKVDLINKEWFTRIMF